MTAGLILAGGQGARMGGVDKAFLTLGGQTLIARAIARLTPQVTEIAISANGDAARFAPYRLPILPDPPPGQAGPLAGVLAGLQWAADAGLSDIVTVAVDTPFFPADLVGTLMDRRCAAPIALAATAGPDGALRLHPTFGLWPVGLRSDLRRALASGTRAMRAWALDHGAVAVAFAPGPPDPFFNINTRADLARAETLAAASSTLQ
jgi:molybdopterin-guanine dinucleotide biosynthesis protein A